MERLRSPAGLPGFGSKERQTGRERLEVKTEISNYMREMQRRSSAARWGGLSAEEKHAEMSALAKARWAKRPKKPERVARRSNAEVSHE